MMTPKRASLLAFFVLVLAILELLERRALLARQPVLLLAQGLAALLLLWARVTFGLRSFHASATPTTGGLVTGGPYRLIRHPIYAALLLFIWAAVASHPSLANLALAVVASGATAVRIVAEERLVTERYPEYAEYAARTKRFIPWLL